MPDFDKTIEMVKYARRRDDRDIEAVRQFLYMAPVFMFLKDYTDNLVGGRYVFVSREWERVYGVKRSFMVGKTDFEFMQRTEAEQLRLSELRALELGEQLNILDQTPHRYLAFKPLRVALIPIKMPDEDRFTYLGGMAVRDGVTA
jgi:PAS domain-containing protein